MRKPVIGIIALCLTALCASCGRVEERTALIKVPEALAEPVKEPDVTMMTTNGDMLELLLDYQLSLRLCNGKLHSIGTAYGHGDR